MDVTLSPAKLKTRDCAKKIRHGSPRLQDLLRERCRQKMKDRRSQLFNKSRFGLEINSKHVQDALTEIVREEFDNLQTSDFYQFSDSVSDVVDMPLDPEEALELESEMIAEQEQWILQEYEWMSQQEIEEIALIADQGVQIFCPLCQKSSLIKEKDIIICNICGLHLPTKKSIEDVGQLIIECANTHSVKCSQSPSFILLPENEPVYARLYLVCQMCSTLALVM